MTSSLFPSLTIGSGSMTSALGKSLLLYFLLFIGNDSLKVVPIFSMLLILILPQWFLMSL